MIGALWVFWPKLKEIKIKRLWAFLIGTVVLVVMMSQFNLSRFVPNQETASSNLVLHSTVGILEPFSQGSFQARLVLWGVVLKKAFLENPLGYGLGTTTTGSTKFFNQTDLGGFFQKESYLFSILFSTGIVGFTLLMVFWSFLLRQIWKLQCNDHSANALVGAVLLGLVFTNIFGNSAVLYAIAGFYYYLVGQILRLEISEKT
jgi:O-antigen ligase